MFKLLPLYGVCFLLVILSDRISIFDEEVERYVYKEKLLFVTMGLITITYAGLRTSYNDTQSYYNHYRELIMTKNPFAGVDLSLASNPGFRIMERMIKLLHFSPQSFIFISSALSIGVALWFIYKYSVNIALSIFLFFTIGYFCFTMSAVKQCLAIAICLIAIDQQIKRRYIRFVLLVLLAMTFHSFSMVFLVSPLLEFKPWTTRTIIVFVLFVILGFSLQTWMGQIVDIVSLMGEEYEKATLVGEGVNIYRVAVAWAPILLSILTLNYWHHNTDYEQNILANLTMLNGCLMFVALFGNPIYFGRLANYFLIFQALSIPTITRCFEKKSRIFVTACVIIFYLAFSYYGNALTGKSFDQVFNSMGINQFLSGIFE